MRVAVVVAAMLFYIVVLVAMMFAPFDAEDYPAFELFRGPRDILVLICLSFFITFILSRGIEWFFVGSVLVMQKLSTQSNDAGEVIGVELVCRTEGVELVCRTEGLLFFFLTAAGLPKTAAVLRQAAAVLRPVTTLVVNSREVVCKRAGLLWVSHKSFPVTRVCEVTTGIRLPVEYLVVVAAVLGFSVFWGFWLIIWLISRENIPNHAKIDIYSLLIMGPLSYFFGLLLFRLNKRFYLRVFSPSGGSISLALSSNMIEGVRLDFDRMTKISSVIRKIVATS